MSHNRKHMMLAMVMATIVFPEHFRIDFRCTSLSAWCCSSSEERETLDRGEGVAVLNGDAALAFIFDNEE